jgi:hypothetical protein
MRMSVDNLNAIRDWAIRNQAAMPDVTLRLVFSTDLAKSVIEQESAPDPQRVIEIGYDISSLMWRVRVAAGAGNIGGKTSGGACAAGTRLILHVLRQGKTETADVVGFIDTRVGKTVEIAEVIGHDDDLDMPEFGIRTIAVERDGNAYSFREIGDDPCRPSTTRNLSSAVAKARRM